jgi:hypothetical protein
MEARDPVFRHLFFYSYKNLVIEYEIVERKNLLGGQKNY